jgi:hypothetical protein
MAREIKARRQDNAKREWLEYPYSFLNEYDLKPEEIIGGSQLRII